MSSIIIDDIFLSIMGDIMALLKNILIDIPKRGIMKQQHQNGSVYIYKIIEHYRNKNGKPRNRRTLIGKLNDTQDKLIPNHNYYDLYPVTPPTTDIISNISVGVSHVYTKIIKTLGLDIILEKNFNKNWLEIIDIATYISVKGNTISGIVEHFEKSFRFGRPLDTPSVSRIFKSITQIQKDNFFVDWAKKRFDKEYFAYDITSISTYSKGITIAAWGYNRGKENLQQINLGMLVGQKTKIPVFYENYNGSIPDKVKMADMVYQAQTLELDNITFVIDQGFNSKLNKELISSNNYNYIIMASDKTKETKEIFQAYRDDFMYDPNHLCSIKSGIITHGKKVTNEDYNYCTHIYHNNGLSEIETLSIYNSISKDAKILAHLIKKPSLLKEYKHFTFYNEKGKNLNGVDWELDTEKVKLSLKEAGYFFIQTNKTELDSAEVLEIYHNRNTVEHVFKIFKSNLEFRRLGVHNINTLDGKLFVGFIALILYIYVENTKLNNKIICDYSCKKIFEELNTITYSLNKFGVGHISALTKIQKEILSAFDIEIDSLKSLPSLI